ncbi:MAG: outer membrane protein assembly factor BamE [Pseudomonadota bacterium]
MPMQRTYFDASPLSRIPVPTTLTALILLASLMLSLGGCATKAPASDVAAAAAAGTGAQTIGPTGVRGALGFFAPFRIDIQQGNFVSSEMLAQLQVGMTPEQVRFALGTPLLVDVFHAQRWEYIFRLQRSNGEVTTSRVTVFFKDERVASFEGGDLPTEAEYLARIAGASKAMKELPAVTPPKAAPSAPEAR